ncbi:MAG TPA: hypothetical protein VJV79_12905 [Polyangiaceae bacterium]|nr:hypothetical protein [Polyangiaceae bacterium]
MTRPRAGAVSAILTLLVMLVAAVGCHRPQPEDARPTSAPETREGGASAKTQSEREPPQAGVIEAAGEASPKRPKGVPADAFWVGGPDGGVFVCLERSNDRKGTFSGKIYHLDGELWYAGALVPNPTGSPVDPTQHEQFAGWDGERLLMTEGRWLESVKAKRGGSPPAH